MLADVVGMIRRHPAAAQRIRCGYARVFRPTSTDVIKRTVGTTAPDQCGNRVDDEPQLVHRVLTLASGPCNLSIFAGTGRTLITRGGGAALGLDGLLPLGWLTGRCPTPFHLKLSWADDLSLARQQVGCAEQQISARNS